MLVLDVVLWPFRAIAERIAVSRRLSRFSCGDCERFETCGQPPHELCAHRLAYIAQYGDHGGRRPVNTAYN